MRSERARWLMLGPPFAGSSGSPFGGLRSKWGRGYGRWVRDVLVWTKAPFLFRNELVPADGWISNVRPAPARSSDSATNPVVMRLSIGSATVEVAAHGEDSELLLGPYGKRVDAPDGFIRSA